MLLYIINIKNCFANVDYSEINIGQCLLMLSLNEYRFNNNHDFISSFTLLSGIMGLLVSENSVVVSTAVWGSLVHLQALIWTHTNRFKDNIVFIQAWMYQKKINTSGVILTHSHHLPRPGSAPCCSVSHYTDVIGSCCQSSQRHLFNASINLHTFRYRHKRGGSNSKMKVLSSQLIK